MNLAELHQKPGLMQRIGRSIDAVVGAISPAAAHKRMQYRAANAVLAKFAAKQAFVGARTDREQTAWEVSDGSPDADLNADTLATLRERSRDRVRNDAIAAASIGSLVDNVVGIGLRPQLNLPWKLLGITEDRARELSDIHDEIWSEWAACCDTTNRLSFEDVQALVFSQAMVNGDSVTLPLMVQDALPPKKLELRLEVVEGDRLSSPMGVEKPNLRQGVELGSRGEPLAYWITLAHPGDEGLGGFRGVGTREHRRVEAWTPDGDPRVLHVFDATERPGQTRGRPLMSAALKLFLISDDIVDATLIATEVGACFAAFVTKTDPLAVALARSTDATRGSKKREQEIRAGTIEYLAPGEDVKFASPQSPGATFDAFFKMVQRRITSSMGMAYEVATRDFSDTTYSQARGSLLEARRMFTRRQRWVGRKLCQPVHRLLLKEAWLKGLYPAGSDFLENISLWTRAHWLAPGWGLLDPLKEASAEETRLRMGVTTKAAIIAGADGSSWRDVFAQRAREQETEEELGLASEQAPQAPAEPAAEPPTDDEDGE